jgi:hypothetical protein
MERSLNAIAPLTERELLNLRLVRLADAEPVSGIRPPTLRRYEREGKIPGYRVGGRLCFKLADLLAFVDASRAAPRRKPPAALLQARAAAVNARDAERRKAR